MSHYMERIANQVKIRKTDKLREFAELLAKKEREYAKDALSKICKQFAERNEHRLITLGHLYTMSYLIKTADISSQPWRKQ